MNGQYYSLDDVIRLLKKSKATVLREAKSGLIPSELEEGKKKGRLYPKQAIDVLVERQNAKNKGRQEPRLVFSYSTPNDLWAEVLVGRALYGEDDIVPFRQLLDWREINDEMFMSLKEEGKVIAYSSLMPLDENIINSLIRDEIRETEIPLSAIKQWSDPHISVYVASVTVKPSGNVVKEKEHGRMIIQRTLKWALSFNEQYKIKNWYGIGATKEGQHLFEELGFTEVISLYHGARRGYIAQNIKQPVQLITKMLAEMGMEGRPNLNV